MASILSPHPLHGCLFAVSAVTVQLLGIQGEFKATTFQQAHVVPERSSFCSQDKNHFNKTMLITQCK